MEQLEENIEVNLYELQTEVKQRKPVKSKNKFSFFLAIVCKFPKLKSNI